MVPNVDISADKLQRACYSLEVFNEGRPVGVIENRNGYFTFQYRAEARDQDFVSLLMPVGVAPYSGKNPGALPPVFDMNLPEGGLRSTLLSRYSKVVSGFNDLALLYMVGRNTIGKVTFGAPAQNAAATLDLNALMQSRDADELLSQLYQGDTIFSGIAGAQPKVIASIADKDIVKFSDDQVRGQNLRQTFCAESAIIKASGPRTPWLAANEFFCLRAAELSGLKVPQTRLFRDGQILVVSRFDKTKEGIALGAEDFCALNAMISPQKYSSSYEKMAKTITAYCSPESTQKDLKAFFKSFVLSCALRNGDAHAKNFMLLYRQKKEETGPDVWLSPVYDVYTTNAYLSADMLALTLASSKRYPILKKLDQFGKQNCNLVASAITEVADDVEAGVNAAALELIDYGRLYPEFHQDIGLKMLNCWDAGIQMIGRQLDIDPSQLVDGSLKSSTKRSSHRG